MLRLYEFCINCCGCCFCEYGTAAVVAFYGRVVAAGVVALLLLLLPDISINRQNQKLVFSAVHGSIYKIILRLFFFRGYLVSTIAVTGVYMYIVI